jgi:hypothetical protein
MVEGTLVELRGDVVIQAPVCVHVSFDGKLST